MASGMGKKSLQALAEWSAEKAVDHWPAILAFFVTGGGVTYIASASDWLKPYGPAGWVLFAVLVMLLLTLGYLGYATARVRIASGTFAAIKAEAGTINALEPIHKRQRINLADLYHPFFKTIKNARFEQCELMGPGNIVALGGSSFDGCTFFDCEIVIVRPDTRLIGVMAAFESCVFLDTDLYRVTLLMPRAAWLTLPAGMRAQVPIISETS
jgi:hypothetical protein